MKRIERKREKMSELKNWTFAEFYDCYQSGKIAAVMETIEITPKMNECFQWLSRSVCPIHTDDEFARSLGYPGAISYGLMYELIAVRCSEMLVGKNCIGYHWEVTFREPVFVGTRLKVKCEAVGIRKSIRNVIEKITITDADAGKLMSEITVKIKMLK